jgi:hypothetical protein
MFRLRGYVALGGREAVDRWGGGVDGWMDGEG